MGFLQVGEFHTPTLETVAHLTLSFTDSAVLWGLWILISRSNAETPERPMQCSSFFQRKTLTKLRLAEHGSYKTAKSHEMSVTFAWLFLWESYLIWASCIITPILKYCTACTQSSCCSYANHIYIHCRPMQQKMLLWKY